MSDAAAVPVQGKDRLHHLDMIRGVALFGILLMNITSFGLPRAYADPTVAGGATGLNLWAWITTTMLFEGTQRALFSILFGAGVILLTSRLETSGRTDVADIYHRRSLWLIVFGVIHSYVLLWTGEILFSYGLAGLFLYPLRKLAARPLLTMAAGGLVILALWGVLDSYNANEKWQKASAAQALAATGAALTEEQRGDIDAWKEFEGEQKPDARRLNKNIEAHRGSYVDVLLFQAPVSAYMQSWFNYRYFFDVFSLMLGGMALFKLGVLRLRSPRRVYAAMVGIGYGVGLAVNYYELRIVMDGQFSVLAFLRSGWTYDLGRLAMTAGYLGALLLFARAGWLPWLQRSLAAVGQMALSNYLAQSIICAFVFYGFGFGLYGRLARHQLYYVVFAIWVFQLITSPIWLKYFLFGPFEWLWRSLTYVKKQPMRRAAPDRVPMTPIVA